MIASIPLLLLGAVLHFDYAVAATQRYDGYKVIKTEAPGGSVGAIEEIFRKHQVDIWRRPSFASQSFDVMVSPGSYEPIQMDLAGAGINFTISISDVQKVINDEEISGYERRQKRHATGDGFYRRYHKFDEIKRWMNRFARENRDIIRLKRIGTTYRGRKIVAIKIGLPRNTTKKIIWQDGGVHAREWITVSTLVWVIKSLVEGYREGDQQIVRFLEEMDWYILPVWNVDGYDYSWRKERLWRKSVGPDGPVGCFGVDLNRNFETSHRGLEAASEDACSEVYQGIHAFSEIESRAVSKYLLKKKGLIAAYITLHSYAQFWMFPYGHTYGACNDYNDLSSLSQRVVRAIREVHETEYRQGSIAELAYKVSGSSVDWSYDVLCVKYSFAVELRDTGDYGFILPPRLIIPTAEEYYAGLKVVADHVINLPDDALRSSSCT